MFLLFTKPIVEVDATRRHLQEQVSLYGDQSLVNLVDQQGYEKPVKEAYERYLAKVSVLRRTVTLLTADRIQANIPQVKYQYFDFHNECKHMRWDRISLLIDDLTQDLLRDGYVLCKSFVDAASYRPSATSTSIQTTRIP